MTANQWRQVNKIFSEAIGRGPGDRAQFIEEACAGDVGLLKEVETLLAAHENAGSFLESEAELLATPGASIAAGTRFGPYEILSGIGSGGMGEVYKAHDARLRRDVAVKVLRRVVSDPAAWERFKREARAASALSHPNICMVHDVGEAGGQPYLVMELLEGITLSTHIEGKPIHTNDALPIAVQIAEALEAAHSKGVIHRDIKAANVMLTSRGRVKILDFGLAKQTAVGKQGDALSEDAVSIVGNVMGTPPYLSPEVLQGAAADARSDLWAFGVLLYQMLSGHLPFTGATVYEMASGILKEPPPRLPESVPAGLRGIVERCLEKRPERRYQSAAEVHAALDALNTRAAPAATTSRRTWIWAAALIAAVAAVAVWRRPQPAPLTLPVRVSLPAPTPEQPNVLSTGGPLSPIGEANVLFDTAMRLEREQSDIPAAQATLEQALKLDPHFPEARRYHALEYVLLLLNGFSNDSSLLYKAREELDQLAREAPDLQSLPSGKTAVFLALGRKDLIPLRELNETIKRNPSLSTFHYWHMVMNIFLENNREAEDEARDLVRRERLFAPAHLYLGDLLRREGRFKEAFPELNSALQRSRTNASAFRYLTLLYLDQGDLEQARRTFDEARTRIQKKNYVLNLTEAVLLAREGKRDLALRAMNADTEKFARAAFTVTLDAAEFYALLGNDVKAFDFLEQAVKNGDERADWFEKNPRLDNIKKDPRFRRIVDSIKNGRKP